MITKVFGKDFSSDGGALTLRASEVGDGDTMSGTQSKTHDSGWTIAGVVHEDYYTWVNEFEASHATYGMISGDFEVSVQAESEEAFAHFMEHHSPEAWNYGDI